MLVVDASVVVAACARRAGFDELPKGLRAPPLMWSEARSTLHLHAAKGNISPQLANELHKRLVNAPVRRFHVPYLGQTAWQIASELGWGRTYDAEYVALAKMLGCRLVTLDNRLRRGADRLGFVVTPTEL